MSSSTVFDLICIKCIQWHLQNAFNIYQLKKATIFFFSWEYTNGRGDKDGAQEYRAQFLQYTSKIHVCMEYFYLKLTEN